MKSGMSPGLIAAGLLCLPLALAWSANKVELNVGDPAPTFQAKDDTGTDWKSSDHVAIKDKDKAKIVVVYFYPADFTGGCTKQACGFRDDMAKTGLKSKDVDVVGVSGDSVATHEAFKKYHNLNFKLLADPEGKIAEQFGVPFVLGEKDRQAEKSTVRKNRSSAPRRSIAGRL